MITVEDFKKLVAAALDEVPENIASQIKNVAILVEEGEDSGELLGLYQGVPQTERGDGYGVGETFPDTITLFMRPICKESEVSGSPLEAVIAETLWHEIGHYMGLDEVMVHRREEEGTNRYR